MLKENILKLFCNLLGRRTTYRLARAMYFCARGEIANNMTTNGEMLIQSGILSAWKKSQTKGRKLTIFDVGANIGEWSLAVIAQLPDKDIDGNIDLYVFEPVPSTAETLKKNLLPNKKYLHIEEIALSSSTGTAEIYFAGSNSGTNSLYEDSVIGRRQSTIIKHTSVSQFCQERSIDHVDLLKCDTEGHDMEVIRGALPMLKEERISVLQFEYNHRWIYSRNFLRDVFLVAIPLSYKMVKLQTNYLLVFDEWHPELDKFFEGNYALIHKDALIWFATKQGAFDQNNTITIE